MHVDKTRDKINSLKDLKNELRAFFSLKGYSKLLDTNSIVIKLFWFICMGSLLGSCMYLVERNTTSFLDKRDNGVVTQIRDIVDDVMIFPAITFCLVDYNTDSISRNLKDEFISGYFDSINNTCSFSDFQKIKIFDPYFVKDFDCYKFNGGRNSNNEEKALQMANFVGTYGGLVLEFNLTINDTLLYHIDDNKVNPTNVELDNLIEVNNQDGKSVNIGIKKTVDKKLPIPYSNCTETIDSSTRYPGKKCNIQTKRLL